MKIELKLKKIVLIVIIWMNSISLIIQIILMKSKEKGFLKGKIQRIFNNSLKERNEKWCSLVVQN